MASRRITTTLTVEVTLDLDEGVELQGAIDHLYLSLPATDKWDMVDWEIIESGRGLRNGR